MTDVELHNIEAALRCEISVGYGDSGELPATQSLSRETALELCVAVYRLRKHLKAIASLGGNLPDDRLEDRTGPNDAKARGIMYCEARRLANAALEEWK